MAPLLPTGTGRGGRRPAGQRGVALIAVLWTVALLSLMAMAFLAETRSHANLTRNLLENAKAEALADAGVYRAVAGLLDADFITGWRADGTVYTLAMGEGEVRITIADEGGKIDLNRAPDALLAGLFDALGVPEGEAAPLVDAIADFRDGDALRRAAGAEDADYAAAGRAWGAKDAPFESVAELQQVLGIDRALYDRVAPYVTVHSGRGQVNPAAAARPVLLAMPQLTEDQVDELLRRRAEANVASLRQTGTAFTIRAEAVTTGGGRLVREALIQRTADRSAPYRIHEWRRTWGSDAEEEEGGGD